VACFFFFFFFKSSKLPLNSIIFMYLSPEPHVPLRKRVTGGHFVFNGARDAPPKHIIESEILLPLRW
jgi:hypothetical protein